MFNFLHEWRMNRKIKRILRENKKHPEQCFNFENYLPEWDVYDSTAPKSALTSENILAAWDKLLEHGGESDV